MAEHSATDKHHHHVIPWHYFVLNFFGLTILMGATIYASTLDLGATWRNNVVAIAIALIKMMLVIMIFMGVKWSTRLTKLWAATGFVWFLLMSIVFGDYFTRDWEQAPGWYPGNKDYPVMGSEPRHDEPDHAGDNSPMKPEH